MKELTYVFVNGTGGPIRIIIVPNGNDEVRIPPFDEIGYIVFIGVRDAIITDHSKDDIICLREIRPARSSHFV
jgi:hypothetical protein